MTTYAGQGTLLTAFHVSFNLIFTLHISDLSSSFAFNTREHWSTGKVCPRSQLVSGSAGMHISVMGNPTTGPSWQDMSPGSDSGYVDYGETGLRADRRAGDTPETPVLGLRDPGPQKSRDKPAQLFGRSRALDTLPSSL